MANYTINAQNKKSVINKDIYGHFSEHLGRCIYDGIWVGRESPIPNVNGVRKDVIDALKQIRIPVLRWPGGCFADTYHWMDAIGPQSERRSIENKGWGGVIEDNSFGTHEFMDMCEELGCDAYLSGNLGSGTVREMSDWVDYIAGSGDSEMAKLRRKNGREKPWKIGYWGIGNESWGCGGQMTPEYYADLYRQYSHFIHVCGGDAFSSLFTRSVKQIASGPNSINSNWTRVVMDKLSQDVYGLNLKQKRFMLDGISLHYYVFGGDPSDLMTGKLKRAGDFDEKDWYKALSGAAAIGPIIDMHDAEMSVFDPEKKVGLMVDEWGMWHGVEPGTNPAFCFQQNTMRDAVIAAISLNIFNKRSDRVKLTTIAQMINVLQSVILTEGESMVLTPTYHVFDMFKEHQNATLLDSSIEARDIGFEDAVVADIFESASVDTDGTITATLCNTSMSEAREIEAAVNGVRIKSASARLLSADAHACNTFERPNEVRIAPCPVTVTPEGFSVSIPAGSVVSVTLSV